MAALNKRPELYLCVCVGAWVGGPVASVPFEPAGGDNAYRELLS